MKNTFMFILSVILMTANAYAQANSNVGLEGLKNALLNNSKTSSVNVEKDRLAVYGGQDIANGNHPLNRQVLLG